MPYRVAFNATTGIVTVKIKGLASRQDHYSARDKAFNLCRVRHCVKILVDLSELKNKSSTTLGCFEFGKSVARSTSIVQIAHVLPHDSDTQKDVKFTSVVEFNRGKITRDFNTVKAAENWLLA